MALASVRALSLSSEVLTVLQWHDLARSQSCGLEAHSWGSQKILILAQPKKLRAQLRSHHNNHNIFAVMVVSL